MRKILFITMFIFALTGCFNEPKYLNNGKPGAMNLLIDWEEGTVASNSLVGHFYPIEGVSINAETVIDTISSEDNTIPLSYGTYNAFVHSDTSMRFLYSGMDKYSTAAAYLKLDPKDPFSANNSQVKYIAQPDSFYIAQIEEFLVNSDKHELQRTIQPRLVTLMATLEIPVVGIEHVAKARASLSGVAESINLSTEKGDTSKTGSIIFDFEVTTTGIKAEIRYFEIFQRDYLNNVLNIVFILENGKTITSKHILDITAEISEEVRVGGGEIKLDAITVVEETGGETADDWDDVEIKQSLAVNSNNFIFDDIFELVGPNLKKDLIINSTTPWEIVDKTDDWLIISAMKAYEGRTTVQLSLDGSVGLTDVRTAKFTVRAGNLTKIIEVRHYGKMIPSPNCYIVAPNGSVDVSVRNVNIFWGKGGDGAIAVKMGDNNLGNPDPEAPAVEGNLILNNEYVVEVIWSDIQTGGLSFTKGLTGFKVSDIPNTEGNIVVGVRKNTSDYLWSWHLWVTSFNPETNQIELPNGRVAMDRNLGATSNAENDISTLGLLYQWGRKDPFVGTAVININTSEYKETHGNKDISNSEKNIGTLLLSVNNPYVFYTGDKDAISKGHLTENSGYNRWGGATSHIDKVPNKNVKSIYDPSPDGWRMPWGEDWSGLTASTNNFAWASYGWHYENLGRSSFFPVAGLRVNELGTLSYVDRSGYYWSGTPSSEINGHCLEIYQSDVVVLRHSRAFGCSVRPVKE